MTNEEIARQWSAAAQGWVDHQGRFDDLYAAATAAILERAEPGPGSRVLDIGCGTGTLLEAAVDRGADAVGIDISSVMTTAAAVRVPHARLVTGDAQTLDLREVVGGRPFDRVVSRFGVMFFEDPVAAFDRIRRATDRARLTFCCWRTLEENPAFTLGTQVLVDRLPPAASVTPGPAAFADPERIRSVLDAAGWSDVTIDPLDFDCGYGFGEDAVQRRLEIVFATSVGHRARTVLRPTMEPSAWEGLLEEVREHIRDRQVNGEVRHPAATWIVTARS